MTHIYDKNLKHLITLNYDYEDFKTNPSLYYPDWKTEYYASPTKYEYPILDNEVIREMTREEKILQLGMVELLIDGEYLQEGKIIKVEYDESLNYHKKAWDKINHIWYEATTQAEFTEMRAKKILEYSKLEQDKKVLENSKFSTQEEIQLLIEKMTALEKEINDIADKIKTL
ncbi:hypothetical protein [Fusobacterium sp.]|uniref:hypothetical protein n=1 Tax=Fusobacterium sp. TaxID=68766 RepID=UPI0025C41456|nr:hypothetical protein [Fusobacterium sp.]